MKGNYTSGGPQSIRRSPFPKAISHDFAQRGAFAPHAPGGEGKAGSALVRLDASDHKTLRHEVLGREITFTDLVVLPDDLQGIDALVERLLSS